ncbi:MAG: hypothetical protein RL590_1095, partial [Actinomycetota bacterium]
YATVSSKIIGNVYPDGSGVWSCGAERCFPSDHAGVVATIELPRSAGAIDPDLPERERSSLTYLPYVVAGALILLVLFLLRKRIWR